MSILCTVVLCTGEKDRCEASPSHSLTGSATAIASGRGADTTTAFPGNTEGGVMPTLSRKCSGIGSSRSSVVEGRTATCSERSKTRMLSIVQPTYGSSEKRANTHERENCLLQQPAPLTTLVESSQSLDPK